MSICSYVSFIVLHFRLFVKGALKIFLPLATAAERQYNISAQKYFYGPGTFFFFLRQTPQNPKMGLIITPNRKGVT